MTVVTVVTMGSPHDAPSATELLEAVREWIERDVIASADARLRFHSRVAANMLAMVEREIALGPAHAAAHEKRLAQLGVADDAELAAAIRGRRFDDRAVELRTLLGEMVSDNVAVAITRYLES